MKSSLCVGAGLILSSASPAAASTNLIRNPGFEEVDPAGLPDAWDISKQDLITVAIDTNTLRSGWNALRLHFQEYPAHVIASQKIPGPFAPERPYEFGFAARGSELVPAEGNPGWRAYVTLRMHGAGDQVIAQEAFGLDQGDTDWQRYARSFSVPPATEYISVIIGDYRNNGTVWLDDFFLGAREFAACRTEPYVDASFKCGADRMTLPEMQSAGITALTHVPPHPEMYAAARACGIRILPYVSAIKVAKSDEGSWGPCVLRHPFWREIDVVRHPEWQAWHRDGSGQAAEYSKNYYPFFKLGCHYQAGYREAIARGVLNLLADGAGGVFVDNVSEYRHNALPCSGPRLGKHDHPDGDQDQFVYYLSTLSNLYARAKSADPDFLVFINAGMLDVYGGNGDISMHENVLQLPPSGNRGNIPADYSELDHRHLNWRRFWAIHQHLQEYQSRYQTDVFTSTTAGDVCTARENLFYSFVFARMIGYNQWGAGIKGPYPHGRRWGRLPDMSALRALYRQWRGIGKPLAPPVITAKHGSQAFEKACLVINPTLDEQEVTFSVRHLELPAVDLFSGRPLDAADDGTVSIRLPLYAGRIIVSRADALRNELAELRGQLEAVYQYLHDNLSMSNPQFKQGPVFEILAELRRETGALPSDPLAIPAADFNRLTMRLAELSPADFLDAPGAQLCASADGLDGDAVRKLLHAPASRLSPPEIWESGDARYAILRSAGAAYSFEPYLNYGADAFHNYSSAPVGHVCCSAERPTEWLIYPQVSSLRFQASIPVPDNKTINLTQGRLKSIEKLAGSDREQNVLLRYALEPAAVGPVADEDTDLVVMAALHQGSPILSMEISLENAGGIVTGAWVEVAHMTGVTTPGNARRAVFGQEADGATNWFFLPEPESTRAGELIIGRPDLHFLRGRLAGQPGAKLKIDLVCLHDHDRYFLDGRLRFARLAAGRAAQLLNNVYLEARPGPEHKAFIGENVELKLAATDAAGKNHVGAEFALQADLTVVSRSGVVQPVAAEQSAPGVFKLAELAAAEGDVLMLNGAADIQTPSAGTFHTEKVWLLRMYKPVISRLTRLPPVAPGQCRYELRVVNNSARRVFEGVARLTTDNAAWSVAPTQYELYIAPAGEFTGEFSIPGGSNAVNTLASGQLELRQGAKTLEHQRCGIHFSPAARVPFMRQPPVLDGKLQDAEWGSAVLLPDFRRTRTGALDPDTQVRLGYDKKHLYLAFHCGNFNNSGHEQEGAPAQNVYDDAALRDDSVEIYLRPDFRNPAAVPDRLGINYRGNYKSESIVEFAAAAGGGPGYWTLEAAIPFKSLGRNAPASGDVWSGNLCRTYHAAAAPGRYGAAWSFLSGGYNQPDQFGWLHFE